jgi:SSS family solute:Na+ symporter
MVSPMEYLATRYNVPAQQLMAWSGVLLKLFDVGAKWASIALILKVFAGVPMIYGILISGSISLFYITLGGLWADALTDLAQFVVQLVAGLCLFGVVLYKLDGVATVSTLWNRLPPDHANWFNGPYTPVFVGIYSLIAFLSYNGGTWNLAQRYIASPSGPDARKAAILSSALYLFWPLILFFPMWAAPVFLPSLANPTEAYSLMAVKLLPPGLVGLVLASMFAHTMAMTTSDANTIAAVITRDILPVIAPRTRNFSDRQSLLVARTATVVFTALTLVVASQAERFGGVLQLLVVWFAGLVGTSAIPMILGLLPAFSNSGATAAIVSWFAGVTAFAAIQLGYIGSGMIWPVVTPVLVSAVFYIGIGVLYPDRNPRSKVIFDALKP